jgi:hypothetical protein
VSEEAVSSPDTEGMAFSEAPFELLFTSLDEFVSDYLTQVVHRRLNRAICVWCPEWWRHPEAVARLAVLWRAFEFLRADPALGLSTWWLHHADPHLYALMNPTFGPFSMCDPRDGHSDTPPPPLPNVRPPAILREHPAFALTADDLADVELRRSAWEARKAAEEAAETSSPAPEPRSPDDDPEGKRKSKDKDLPLD